MALALELDRVSKRFGKGTVALNDVTWSVATGARACLLGPNGAGKSTAIRLLEGALRPTRGTVRLLNTLVGSADYQAARRRTGIVPQGPGMYQDLSTGEYLELARRLYGASPSALDRVEEAFGLGEHRTKMLSQLSGGFQRRVCLAVALLGEPTLLLLDEPTVGLDPVAANEVHAYLRDAMAAAGRTTLLCTHNLAEAEALCDEVIILRQGKVLVHDSLANLRQRDRPRVRLAARQGVEPLLAALRARGLAGERDGSGSDTGVVVPMADVPAEAPALLRGLLGDGLDVYECRRVQVTLEAVFLDLVRSAEAA